MGFTSSSEISYCVGVFSDGVFLHSLFGKCREAEHPLLPPKVPAILSALKCQTLSVLLLQWYSTMCPPHILVFHWHLNNPLCIFLLNSLANASKENSPDCAAVWHPALGDNTVDMCHVTWSEQQKAVSFKSSCLPLTRLHLALCCGKIMYSKNIFYYWQGHKQEWASGNREALWANS